MQAGVKITRSFKGAGGNPIIEKPFQSHTFPNFQYVLGVTGDTWSKSAGSLRFYLSPVDTVATGSGFWDCGEWQHVVGTYNNLDRTMKLYVNGKQVGASRRASGPKPTDYGQDVFLAKYGNLHEPSHHLPAVIDNVMIFSRALPEVAIKRLYKLQGGE